MDGRNPFRPPNRNHFYTHPESRWPAWKFDMEMADAWTTLPREFNCMTIPLLSGDAFRRDLFYLSTIARDRAEFLALLKERRDAREKELTQMWNRTFSHLCHVPSALEYKPGDRDDGHWGEAMGFAQWKSFDTLVTYFASFLPLSPPMCGQFVDETAPSSPPRAETTLSPPSTASESQVASSQPASTQPPPSQRPEWPVRSGRVQKPTQQHGPRRSSRLQQKKESPGHHGDPQPQHGTISQAAATSLGKRKSSDEADDHEPQAKASRTKRRKMDTSTGPPPPAATPVGKRKRGSDDTGDSKPPAATARGESDPKRRRKTDTSAEPPPAASTLVRKRKGGSDETSDAQSPAATAQGEPGLKRRRKTDTSMGPPPAAATSDSNKKGPAESGVSGTKRRRIGSQSGRPATSRTRTEPGTRTSSSKRGSRVTKSRQRGMGAS